MKKNKKYFNFIVILLSAIVLVLLFYIIFYQEKEITFNIKDELIQLKIGEQKLIDYEISDEKLNIEWVSDNDVVSINNGYITSNNYGTATITGMVSGTNISDTLLVTTYSGDMNVSIESINKEDGYLLMKPNSEYVIPFDIIPSNSYITSINYSSTNENVAIIENNKVISKNIGVATIKMIVNSEISSELMVKVVNDTNNNHFVKEIESISFNDKDLSMEIGESRELTYQIKPSNYYIENIKWSSTNEEIVSVSNGIIKANKTGSATIKVEINSKIASINVTVKATNAVLKIDYNPKTTIRIGENTTIKSHIEPSINEEIIYKSSNPSVAKVDNGIITGMSSGTTVITLSISNGRTKTFTIHVLPKNGNLSSVSSFWGYKSLNALTPKLTGLAFYQSLARKGIGVLQSNNYILSSKEGHFTYDVSSNILTVENKRIKVRIYAPSVDDLSTLNTLVYMGGTGEKDFGGIFTDIDKDPSMIKSAGIVALLAEGESFDGDSGAYVTKFLKAITKQKDGVKNSILGFSAGAHKVLHASNLEKYNSIVIFSGYTDYVTNVENAKTSEVIFMIANNDGNYSQAKSALNSMRNSGYKNLTFVSNGNDLSSYTKDVLLINPGSLMKRGHYSINVINSGIIEYLND